MTTYVFSGNYLNSSNIREIKHPAGLTATGNSFIFILNAEKPGSSHPLPGFSKKGLRQSILPPGALKHNIPPVMLL